MIACWPDVIDEDRTLDAVLSGKSIARYGDGELKLCIGGDCISQKRDPKLAKELKEILFNPDPRCIVGTVRNIESPKNWFWQKVISKPKYIALHNPKVQYYSQWITRPDSAPWINRQDFWNKLISIWAGKDVTLVAGSDRSLSVEKLSHAKSVEYIQCHYTNTYEIIDDLEAKCLASPNHIILLCCGATATVLAHRLAIKGKHALDLGHIGFFREYREASGKFNNT